MVLYEIFERIKKMKWTAVLLVVFGILAAFFAAMLVGAMRLRTGASSGSDNSIVVVEEDLPAMTVLTSGYVTKRDAGSKKNLPKEYINNLEQAIGRVLSVSVVKGQVLTDNCLITSGTAAQLAATIPAGMRAIGVTLSKSSVTGGLLYPGCVVDIIAAFKLSTNNAAKGQAISTTILQGIEVIAVEDDTIVTPSSDNKPGTSDRSNGMRQTVTLMVDQQQAKTLQLAMEHGSISLAMRNPRDMGTVDFEDAVVLKNGRFREVNAALKSDRSAADANEKGQMEIASAINSDLYQQPSNWQVHIIRGCDVEDKELELSRGEIER